MADPFLTPTELGREGRNAPARGHPPSAWRWGVPIFSGQDRQDPVSSPTSRQVKTTKELAQALAAPARAEAGSA